ncbi:hypothetical protein IQ07DRAFT_80693 [Pyrenochaeta sp. DS3sAY3a]|nr:hypothetical protein IQ07DRAFT_80693 [Pyrenochaeta sp. DS3sAY3a]
MSDPFSVAGTAVGITSLGIQTCQILIRYYSQFRGIHQDIDDVLKRVESLECILERLVAVNTKMSSYESSNLETALNSCAQASQRLKDLVDKVSTGLEGKSNQDRLRAARSRLMWPFKKETLADLKLNLNDFQDNLALALQVSGLDVALQTADQLTSTKNHIYGATNRIECELRSQSDVMTLVREGVEGFNDTQREQASIVSQELFQLQARLLAHEESIDRKFHSLISQTNIGIMNRPVPLSLLVDTAQAASDAKHHFRRGLENCDTLTSSRLDLKPQISSAHRDACTCRAKQRSTFKTYRWKILLSQNTYKHRKDCPQYSPQEFSRTIEAQITMCNRIMQFCVVVGWKQSKQAGWSSSAPVFRYRPVVRSGTGVFEAYSMAMEHYSRAIRTPVDRRFESTISVFTNHLRRCYSTGLGSPFDIDEFGRSILIVSSPKSLAPTFSLI